MSILSMIWPFKSQHVCFAEEKEYVGPENIGEIMDRFHDAIHKADLAKYRSIISIPYTSGESTAVIEINKHVGDSTTDALEQAVKTSKYGGFEQYKH